MTVFDEHREDDYDEFCHRFEGLKVEIEYPLKSSKKISVVGDT